MYVLSLLLPLAVGEYHLIDSYHANEADCYLRAAVIAEFNEQDINISGIQFACIPLADLLGEPT